MRDPFKKDNFFNRFMATKERSPMFRFFVIFLVLMISVFMILRFTYYMIK
jgi:hypothetical protein